MLCFCVEEVDLEVFRGVFSQQWLRGRSYPSREPIFFCTSCGPPAVQEALKDAEKKAGGKAAGKSGASTPTAGKEKSKFSLSKIFGKGFSSSKKDLTTATAPTSAGSPTGTPLASSGAHTAHSRTFTGNNSSFGLPAAGGGGSASPTPALQSNATSQSPFHSRGFSAEEVEAPVTPRTEEELFLCATCGACYCKNHASDHRYSRRRPDEANWCGGGGNVVNLDEKCPLQGYPHHSMFIGVPSYISTHPAHLIEETPWGLLFPTVVMREVEAGYLDLSREYAFFENPETLLDSLIANDCNPSAAGGSGGGLLHGRSKHGSSTGGKYTQRSDSNGMSTRSASGSMLLDRSLEGSMKATATSSTPLKTGGGPLSAEAADPPRLPSQGLLYTSQGSDRWSYMCWCARCGTRPVRMSAKHYDDSNARQRRLRQLGQLLAILSYFCRRGVRLELPARFIAWKAADDAAQQRRQSQPPQYTTATEKRVGKATESVEFTVSANAASRAGEGSSAVTDGSTSAAGASDTIDLTHSETARVLVRACLSGFSNPSYLCYMNSVLQCVLRCVFFTRPLVKLPSNGYPGKLTKSLGLLLHQLEQQTYQDVRNGAIYPYVKAVYQQICQVSSLFELDEQQDAQELLITLLNGVADEFDKGKSAEEKSRMARISFEGSLRSEVVCSRCHHRVPRDEMFMSLSIPIKESIEEGLRGVFTPCYLRGKDRYACERCFKKLSPQQQTEHNEQARVQAEERKRLRAEGKKVTPTNEDPAKHKTENCLYQEAEVRTSITRLGGSLAIHLLRFHYDAEQQDFVKVASPVTIPLTIDLASYVSTEVLETYNTARSLRTLRGRFPALDEPLLLAYLNNAGGDQGLATKQLLSDGYGVEDNLESSVTGDPPATSTPPTSNSRAGPTVKPPVTSSAGAASSTPANVQGKVAPAQEHPVPPQDKKTSKSPTPGPVPVAPATTKSSNSKAQTSASAKPPTATATAAGRGMPSSSSPGVTKTTATTGASAAAEEPSVFAAAVDDDDDSVAHSSANGGVAGGGAALRDMDGTSPMNNAGADSPNSPADTPQAAGALRGRRSILGPGVSPAAPSTNTHPKAAAPPSSALTPQQIMKLKTSDFDPFGDRSCPVAGGGTGEKRMTGGAKGLGRTPSLTRQLVGIVTHRGSLHGGHYIAYVRHLGRPEVWFRCDDEDVDIVSEKTVLGCGAEVYLAFYE